MPEICPLILLHGGLADHRACRPFAEPLSARFRVITPDLLGAGRSHHPGPLSWDLLADDVAALARRLGIERAVLGGISFGAACATRVALRHPALVAALVVLTPAYGGADLGFTPAQTAAMQAMAAAGRRALTDGIAALHPLLAALPAAIQDRARAMIDSFDPASVAATTAFMASGAQPFATGAELAAITAPTLLVPGTDPTHPPEVAEVYRLHLPRCTVRSIEPADFSADYAAAIAELLELASVPT
jgi:pimeloyl-ACP methyl ester carboxylesterase